MWKRTVVRRFLLLLPIIFLISFVSFLLIMRSPGDTARLILMHRQRSEQISEADIQAFAEQKGLNRSALSLYTDWLAGLVSGNLGNSLLTGEPVSYLLKNSLSKTLQLTLLAFSVKLLISFPLGFAAALKAGSLWDKISEYWSVLAISTPYYWMGQVVL